VPFFVGGHEIAKTSAREADALLFYFVSRIRLATISLDGEPRTTKLIAEGMAREFVASAPRLAFARSTLDPDAKDRLAKKFAQLLHDCKPRRWARNDNAEQLLARARADEEDFERIAPRFARAALSVWGYTPQEARNLFDFRRKRVDRAIDASLNAGR